ncbi:MAG: copper transporter [Firmicutes bacterium]|nr:copper transporter [Bacillota bacterium]
MLIDIRYHLASLIGIFLALGIGMLVGIQLSGDGLREEQLRLAERIETSLEQVRADNRALAEQLAAAKERLALEQAFTDRVVWGLVSGTLAGHEVEMHVPAGEHAAVDRIRAVLEAAGARVQVQEHFRLPAAWPAAPARGAGLPKEDDARAGGEPDGDFRDVVVVWSGEWPYESDPAFPDGAVLAVPGLKPGARPSAPADEIVERADTPGGLLALVERLRTGRLPVDPEAVIEERLGL